MGEQGIFQPQRVLLGALATAIATLILIAGAPSAKAAPPSAQITRNVFSISPGASNLGGVEIDGDFIYWVQATRKHKKVVLRSLQQQSISTGLRRTLYSSSQKGITVVRAGGGRLAFSTVLDSKRKKGGSTIAVYAMNNTDAAPALLTEHRMKTHYIKETFRKHGKLKHRRILVECGTFAQSFDVTELGQVVVDQVTFGCSSDSFGQRLFSFDPGAAKPRELPGGDDGFPLMLQSNLMLLITGDTSVVARNVVDYTKRTLTTGGLPTAAAISKDGWIAVSSVRLGRRGVVAQSLNLFAPNSVNPTFTRPLGKQDSEDLEFCGDSLLEIAGYGSQPSTLTLLNFTGGVITQVSGPRSDQLAALHCDGRHVLAVSLVDGSPVLAAYDL
ncbi:MAG: hypothetical protein ACRDKI_06555 [Solirubrobacterales bacterium]